jgi:hypothetical protein
MALSSSDLVIKWILLSNGVYDILCALSILSHGKLPLVGCLAQLHSTMYKEEIQKRDLFDSVFKRMLAFWIFTYGCIRLVAGLDASYFMDILAAVSYFIEAVAFEYESRVGDSMDQAKVTFVSIFSGALGVLMLMRPCGYL